jgi:hypothetical protein
MSIRPSRWSGKTSPASIAARLPAEAKRLGLSVEAVRDAYVREAFFRRLAVSSWHNRFVLKGSVLLVGLLRAWHRPTLDADFLVLQTLDSSTLSSVLLEIISIPLEDCVIFDPNSLRLTPMQEDARMIGQRAIIEASLGRGRLIFRADIGFNDIVTPNPNMLTLETVLSEPVSILGSTITTVIAEKFDAMLDLGLANTRAKDFYDLALIAKTAEVDGETLLHSLRATFLHRGRTLPNQWPEILDTVAANSDQIQRYHQFLAQANRTQSGDLPAVIGIIKNFLSEPLLHSNPSKPFGKRWRADAGWMA